MDWPPLSSHIEIDSKIYSVETAAEIARNRITSSVRLAGHTLSQRVLEYTEGLETDAIRQRFKDFHRIRTVELESIFRLARKIDEKPTAEACNKLGVILLSNGFHDDARQKFMRAMEQNPGHLPAMKNYGITLSLLGDHAGAVAALHKAKELNPGFADLYYHLGNIHLDRFELDEATQNFLQALQINPRYADSRLKLAATCVGYLLQSGKTLPETKVKELEERVIAESDTAAQLNPKVRNRAFLMAQYSIKLKRYEVAFQQFMEVRPKFVPRVGDEVIFFFTLMLLYGSEGIDQQMTDQYVDKLNAVIEEYPQYADLHQHLAVAHLIKTRFVVARSLREFKNTLEINPHLPRAQDSLVEAEEVHKRVLQALRKAIILT